MQSGPNIAACKRLIVFVGNYGSGKTEVAVNFCRYLKRGGEGRVAIVDLDIVNPYFRSREAKALLQAEGIELIAPGGEHFYADLPIVVPEVRGGIQRGEGKIVLDVGGDDQGAKVLASFSDLLAAGACDFWVVLNAHRPFTETAAGAKKMVREIEAASGLRATGLVANTHLLHETTAETVRKGVALAREVCFDLSLPLVFAAASQAVAGELRNGELGCPLLPLDLTMLRPWERRKPRGLRPTGL